MKLLTALIEAVHPQDVVGTHLRGCSDDSVGVGDGNDGGLSVSREGKPVEDTNRRAKTELLEMNP